MLPSTVLREATRKAVSASGGGARRFEYSHGLAKWSLRGLLDAVRPQSPSIDRAAEICKAVGLELYVGPPRAQPTSTGPRTPDASTPATVSAPPEFALQHAVDVQPLPLPMQAGTVGYSPTGCAWFGANFLRAFDLRPEMCRVVMLFDDSMEPALARGSNLLVDTGRAEPVDGLVYAIETDGKLLVRRARAGEEGSSFVAGADSLPPVAGASATVVGQVVWAARLLGLGIDAADALKQIQGQH